MTRVALLAVLAIVAAGWASGRSDLRPQFRPAPGWHVGSKTGRVCPGVSKVRCDVASGWASTVSYRDCSNCVPPHHTLAALRPGGVLIQLEDVPPTSRSTPRSWPPRIRAADVRAGFEGVPPRFGMVGGVARRHGIDSYFYVWFGRAHPTRAQLARANAELARISP